MKRFYVSDRSSDGPGYIKDMIGAAVKELGGEVEVCGGGTRHALAVAAPDRFEDFVRGEAEDKIADVIAVRYKYSFIRQRLKLAGLTSPDAEILYSAVIAADVDEDKKYIVKKLRSFDNYAIDGVFNFRLAALKRKWAEVCEYVPSYFPKERLVDFVACLVEDKRSKVAVYDGGELYDRHFRPMRRTSLVPGGEGRILREVLLSGCGRVRVKSDMPAEDEEALKKFFGNAVFFG